MLLLRRVPWQQHRGRAASSVRRKSLLDAPSERQAKLGMQRGVHVASFQNAALEHLKSTEHPLASIQPWKQAKLNCTKCDSGVATRATVRGYVDWIFIKNERWIPLCSQEATLFSAKHVSLKLPLGFNPIVSISGVPSDKHLNHVNVLTAFQRFAMFHQRTLQDIAQLKKQRIPNVVQVDEEDAARLDLYKVQLQRYHHDLNLIYSSRFWNLVDEMERQCQMHMHYVPSRYLFYLLKSLLALHVAPSKLMEYGTYLLPT
ncbi:hypothetical protein DYB35_008565 [Aphanomyces astaci]|uniref:Uncharacterized protein n=1 Tax=Aphanomyces astaci TaxID=112090 RepID=A0A3R6WFH6_APHAT|nr:hypothetical protein DYB35_008565 [Aphanomyces astaci]